MFEILSKIFSFIWNIWSSLSQDQKDHICKVFTDLMDEIFRKYYRNNGGTAQ